MSIKRFVSLFVIAIAVVAARANADCYVGGLINTNLPGYSQQYDPQIVINPEDLNIGVNKWAAIFNDLSDPGCQDPTYQKTVRDVFLARLKSQSDYGGFRGFLSGGGVAFAYMSGLVVGGQVKSGKIDTSDPAVQDQLAQIDALLHSLDYASSISGGCGYLGFHGQIPGWETADTCMDDFTLAALGHAWKSAYFSKSTVAGDTALSQQERLRTIGYIVSSFSTNDSICIYNPALGVGGTTGPCNASAADLKASLDSGGNIQLLPLNHGQENPNYGIGLLTSIAGAFIGLEVSGRPVVPVQDFGASKDDIDTIMRGLFLEAQHASDAQGLQWRSDACYFATGPIGALIPEDMDPANRNRACADRFSLSNCNLNGDPFHYTPEMYPLRPFYIQYGFQPGDSGSGFQFNDAQNYPKDRNFLVPEHNCPGSNSGPETGVPLSMRFLGIARYHVYYTLTAGWLNPGSRPTLDAINKDNECPLPDITISAPRDMDALSTATASVVPITPEPGSTVQYAWNVVNATSVQNANTPTVTFTAGCSDGVFVGVTITVTDETCPDGKVHTVTRSTNGGAFNGIDVRPPTVMVIGSSNGTGGGATATARFSGPRPWNVEWTDGTTDPNASNPDTHTFDPSLKISHFIVSFTGGGCPGIIHESFLFMDDVFASPGQLTTLSATLTSNIGPVDNQKVHFHVLGRDIVGITNALGVATVSTIFDNVEGTYPILVTYDGGSTPAAQNTGQANLYLHCGLDAFTLIPQALTFTGSGTFRPGTTIDVPVTVTVLTSSKCSWSPTTDPAVDWVTLNPTSFDSFTVSVKPIDPARDPSSRKTNIRVGGRLIPLQQTASCTYTITPAVSYLPAEATMVQDPRSPDDPMKTVPALTQMTISAPPGCTWTLVPDPDQGWLHFVDPNYNSFKSYSGVGTHVNETRKDDGTLYFYLDNNPTQGPLGLRTQKLSITDGQQTTLKQNVAAINQLQHPACQNAAITIDLQGGGPIGNPMVLTHYNQDVVLSVIATGSDLKYTWFASHSNGTGQRQASGSANQLIAPNGNPDFYPSQAGDDVVTYWVVVQSMCGNDVGVTSRSRSFTFSNGYPLSCVPPNGAPGAFQGDLGTIISPQPGAFIQVSVRLQDVRGFVGTADVTDGFTYQWYNGFSGDTTNPVGFNGTTPTLSVSPFGTAFYWVQATSKNQCTDAGGNQLPRGVSNSSTAIIIVTRPPKPRVAAHDFTGDGLADLVWHNDVTGENELWQMNGLTHTATWPIAPNPDTGAQLQSIGDLDGDGHPDLVWRNPQTGANSVWIMSGTLSRGPSPIESRSGGQWAIGAVADFDGDGQQDIAWHNNATGENEIWFQSNVTHAGTWTLPPTPDANWGLHGTADFTGDGKPDLFFHNRVTGENSVWIMNNAELQSTTSATGAHLGTGAIAPSRHLKATVQAIDPLPDTNWVPVQVVDLTGDGRPDIVWRNTVTGENMVWQMFGTTHTGTYPIETRSDTTWNIGGGGSTKISSSGGDSRTATAMTASATSGPANGAAGITATLTANGAPLGNRTVVFSLNGSDIATLVTDGNGTAGAGVSLTGIAPGTYAHALAVRFDGDSAYAPSSAPADLVVTAAQPNVTWATPAAILYGIPLGSAQLNATADFPGTFVYSPATGAILDAGDDVLSVTFTPSDTTIAPITKNVVLHVNPVASNIAWPQPAPIPFGTPLSATQLHAIADTPGSFLYDPEPGTILPPGTATLHATFIPVDLNHLPATASTTLTVAPGTQSITWATPRAITYGQPLTATQLDAFVTVSGPTPAGALTYTPPAGTILTAGTHTLTVTAAATAVYAGATASVQIVVVPARPAITWPTPAPIVYGTALSSTQLNASANVAGTFVYAPAAGTILNAGNQTLSVTFTPTDPNYSTSTASVTINVLPATPVITWTNPASIVYGTPLSSTQLNASANVAGTFVYTPPAGTILNAGTAQTLSVQFTPNDTRDYVNATASVTIDVAKAKQTITWATPAPIVYGTPLSSTQLNATTDGGGALTYTPPAGTILQAGLAQTLTVTAATTPNYEAATATVAIDVLKATPSITWPAPASIVYGTLLDTTQLDATANVAGTFAYTPAAGTQLTAGTQTLSAHFTPTDTHNYNDADATVTIVVTKAKQTLSWTPPSPIVYGTPLSSTQLDATVSVVGPAPAGALVYAPASGTVLDAGTRTLTVTALETANYLSATMSVSLTVNRAPLTLVVDAKSKLYGAAIPLLTGMLTGVVNGDAIAPSYATTATASSPAGTYPITGTLLDPSNRLGNYNVTITPSTLTVLPAPLQIAANPATKQYSDPLPQLGATFTGFVLGETPAVLAGSLSITTTATQMSAPGTYPIAIGGLTSTNYAIVYTGATLTVTQEDARVTITSPTTFSGHTVTMTANVKDISITANANGDIWPGDITKATLTFVDRTDDSVLCTATIGLIDTGTGSITNTNGLGTCSFTTNATALRVGAKIGGYYIRNVETDDVNITIVPPTTDFITGSGAFDAATRFNLALQYDKDGNVKGSFTYDFTRNINGTTYSYELTAASIGSMTIVRTKAGGTAAIVGTGTLRDVTKPSAPVLVVDGAPLIITAADNGEPSTNDTLSVMLLNSDGGLWASTGWNGTRPLDVPLVNGNISVHYGK